MSPALGDNRALGLRGPGTSDAQLCPVMTVSRELLSSQSRAMQKLAPRRELLQHVHLLN
jgi:hypothetical protein